MRIRAISDLHITESTAPLVFSLLRELIEDSIAYPDSHTVICGDIFDVATTVHVPTLIQLSIVLSQFKGRVYVIAGNHDQYGLGGHSVLVLLLRSNTHIVLDAINSPIGAMLPYYGDGKWKERAVMAVEWTKRPLMVGQPEPPHLIWCHQGFRGAYVNAMRRDSDGVSAREVPDGWLAVSGHYHMPQFVGRQVLYVGSPYQTSFSEEVQDKGWLLWEDATKEIMPQRVAFTTATPRYHTIRWNPDDGPPVKPADLCEGDRVRVVTPARRSRVASERGQLEAAGLAGVSVLAAADVGAGRGLIDATDPREAAEQFAYRSAPHLFGDLTDRAEEWGLWSEHAISRG